MPGNLTIQQLAQAIKMRDPRLVNEDDFGLVMKVLERRPDLIGMLQSSSMIQKAFGQGTVGETFSRMWTPGIKYLEPSKEDDPLYMNLMKKLWAGQQPKQPSSPGIDYIQELARKFRDAKTVASTVGVK